MRVAICVLLAAMAVAACKPEEERAQVPVQPAPETQSKRSPQRDSGGLGMTYTGRVGIEVLPGLIITPDGIGMGFGF